MRDAFDGYDSWLERPYQEQYAREEEQEWIDENTTFETQCCGVDVTKVADIWEKWEKQQAMEMAKKDMDKWTEEERKCLVFCTECQGWYLVNKIEPDLPEYDGPDEEPDDRDYY